MSKSEEICPPNFAREIIFINGLVQLEANEIPCITYILEHDPEKSMQFDILNTILPHIYGAISNSFHSIICYGGVFEF